MSDDFHHMERARNERGNQESHSTPCSMVTLVHLTPYISYNPLPRACIQHSHADHASYTPKMPTTYKSPFSSTLISSSNQSSFSLHLCSHQLFNASSSLGKSAKANRLACIRNLYPALARFGQESCSSKDDGL